MHYICVSVHLCLHLSPLLALKQWPNFHKIRYRYDAIGYCVNPLLIIKHGSYVDFYM
jgi:hypothetical protein